MLSLTSSRSQTMKLFPAKISGHVAMCSRPPKNMKLGGFTSQSCKTAKKHTKKRACTCNAVFFSNLNLLHFSPSHCPRRCRCCLSCLLFRWPIDFRNQNYLFLLVPWDQVSIHHLRNEVEIEPSWISQWLLGQVKNWLIAERHAPRNDARNNCGTLSVLVPFSLPKWRMSGL